jgi:hypothetical protein
MPKEMDAPISPDGWQVIQHFYDGTRPIQWLTGISLQAAQQFKSLWTKSVVFNDGKSEVYIQPVEGWETIEGDPVLAIAWALHEGLLTPELGAARLKELMGDHGKE